MNSKIGAIVFVLSMSANLPIQAEELTRGTTVLGTPMTMNTATIAASTVLSPGQYVATVVPSFNDAMSTRLVNAVLKVPGIKSVSSNAGNSSIHFTVKNGSNVREGDIQRAVAKADAGALMSTPILENSMAANPGL